MLGKGPYLRGEGADHCQRYTRNKLMRLLGEFRFKLEDFSNSDSFLTVFSPLSRNRLLGTIDTKLADVLPYWLACGWYFVFEMGRTA
jgi:hypothetical protein